MKFEHHELSGPWFETPFYEENRLARDLTPEAAAIIDDYSQKGFARVDFKFDTALIDEVASLTASLHGRYSRVQDLWRKSDAVRKLGAAPQVLSLLGDLYERRAFPFQTLNFPVGSQQATHSDTYHFNSCPPRFMCGVWVALEDVDAENGPLHYYPGSHKLPVLSPLDIGANDYEEYVSTLMLRAGFEKELGFLKRGEAIIWSANLFHGGEPIRDPARTRLSQVTHYYFDDCLYYTPATSKAAEGKMSVRAPYDFAEMRYVKNRLNGETRPATLRSWVGTRLNNLVKRTPQEKVTG